MAGKTMRRRDALVAGAVAAMVAGLVTVAAQPAWAATVTVDLCARPGSVTMPGTTVVPIWGFAPGPCAAGNPATLPGPVLQAVEGDTLVVNLEVDAAMPEAVSLMVPNLNGIPDTTGVGPGATAKTYTFTDLDPGTYLYESGANSSIQVPMGLHGALVVASADAGTVYGAGTGTGFDTESTLVLSELDVDLNGLIDPNDFVLNDYAPDYFLINGAAYPDTDNIPAVMGDDEVLLRFVNAGLLNHSVRVLGLHQRVVGRESRLLVGKARDVVAELLTAGEVAEGIATVPAGASPGAQFAVSSRNGRLTNNRITGGGMLTFIEITSPPAPPPLPLSFAAPGSVGAVTFGDEDVVTIAGAFSLAFDGSVEGLAGNADVDALDILGPAHFLLSFDRDAGTAVPDGVGVVDDSDVVEFNSGTFSLYFDGSDVGLTTNAEDVDAIELLTSGALAVSTGGDPVVPGVLSPAPRDEDLLGFTSTSLGATTAGSWALWFDGSDVGLGQAGEDTDAAAISPSGDLLLSTRGPFTVSSVNGADEDVFVCGSPVFGSASSCTFSPTLLFDGSAVGLTASTGGDASNNVDGIG